MSHYKYLNLLSSVILVGGISAVAAESAKPFSNFYVGVGTGYSIFNGRSVSGVSDVNYNSSMKKQLHSQGFLGKVFGGYEALSSSSIYGAAEGYFLFDPQKSTYENKVEGTEVDQEKFSRQIAFGIRGKLGASLNETVIAYGILGAEKSRFTFDSKSNGQKKTQKKYLWAVVPGAGMSVSLSGKTKLTIEYTYARYQVFSSQLVNGYGVNCSNKVRPSINTLSVGIVWSL